MQALVEIYDIVGWKEKYDLSDATYIIAELTVETERLRHKITVGGLDDKWMLNEVFHGCRGIRVLWNERAKPQYTLEVIGYEDYQFDVKTYSLETRDRPHGNR